METPVEIAVCEIAHLILTPGQLYRFHIMPDCKECAAYFGAPSNIQVQTSGPQCKKCGAFTTRARVESHGLCMKCEIGPF